MFNKKLYQNTKGFTLIELMIVIAIIGILAAIAIPNFISYRNKAYCSQTESDANTVAGAIANYFSIPSNTSVSDTNLTVASVKNAWTISGGDDPNNAISITVTDGSERCPSDYKEGMDKIANPTGYWVANDSNDYVKVIQ